jgi:thiamine kinase-like enzyme
MSTSNASLANDDESVDSLAVMRSAVQRTFPDWGASLTLVPLAGGLTNRNAVVSVPSLMPRRFVVRLPGERTELLGIDRRNEAEAALRAAELGIAPPVIGLLDGIGTLVTELVPGGHLEPHAFVARLDEVVRLIAQFHRSGPLAGAFPIHRVVEWHARDAATHGATIPPVWGDLHAVSLWIEREFAASPDDIVPCHNDLLPANVLFSHDRAVLLDFEYAGNGDRFFDLANLSINCGLDAASDERLLALYFGGDAVTEQHRAKLRAMKVMSEIREGMWAVVQQAISNLETDFVSYANHRLASAVTLARQLKAETQQQQR